MVCDGDGRGQGHCCVIRGVVCEFLLFVGGTPRCPFMLAGVRMSGHRMWERSPVGRFFADQYPGFDCADWPQNIPEAMNAGRGLCCWREG